MLRIRRGSPAHGHIDTSRAYPRVSIAWHWEQFDAINRRVVKNKTTFAHEARRLMDMALKMDHLRGETHAEDH